MASGHVFTGDFQRSGKDHITARLVLLTTNIAQIHYTRVRLKLNADKQT